MYILPFSSTAFGPSYFVVRYQFAAPLPNAAVRPSGRGAVMRPPYSRARDTDSLNGRSRWRLSRRAWDGNEGWWRLRHNLVLGHVCKELLRQLS